MGYTRQQCLPCDRCMQLSLKRKWVFVPSIGSSVREELLINSQGCLQSLCIHRLVHEGERKDTTLASTSMIDRPNSIQASV